MEICEPAVLLSELVREMPPGSRVKQGQNLLFLNCCPFAADVSLQGLPHSGLHSHCNAWHQHPTPDQHGELFVLPLLS